MKMVKSLLLGSAAGVVAISGAQAADLPVKAKAVDYVKVCSVYGAGFYYVPGTDTCIKVGGYVRLDVGIRSGGSHAPYVGGVNARDSREVQDYQTRSRGIVSWDARTSTEWGTLRAYIRAGWEQNSGDLSYRGTTYFDRAFIQFGGLTVGKTQSFMDFYANALNYSTLFGGGPSNGTGINLVAYTAQFGGGFSATLSLEDTAHLRGGMYDASIQLQNSNIGGSAAPNYGDYRGSRYPDIIASFRVDQPWGSAQISGAIHDASAQYYGANLLGGSSGLDDTGYAVTGGVKFNLPWAKGDELWLQATYTHGATHYLGLNPFVHFGSQVGMYSGQPTGTCAVPTAGTGTGACGSFAAAYSYDGVFNVANGLSLVDGYSLLASVQHYWTPSLRTSVFGHYTHVDYGGRATATYCSGAALALGTTAGAVQFPTGAGQSCNPDYSIYQLGTRTIWSPVANLDIGVEVLYTKIDQSMSGNYVLAAQGSRPAGSYSASDQDTWSGTVRFQRNFWP